MARTSSTCWRPCTRQRRSGLICSRPHRKAPSAPLHSWILRPEHHHAHTRYRGRERDKPGPVVHLGVEQEGVIPHIPRVTLCIAELGKNSRLPDKLIAIHHGTRYPEPRQDRSASAGIGYHLAPHLSRRRVAFPVRLIRHANDPVTLLEHAGDSAVPVCDPLMDGRIKWEYWSNSWRRTCHVGMRTGTKNSLFASRPMTFTPPLGGNCRRSISGPRPKSWSTFAAHAG